MKIILDIETKNHLRKDCNGDVSKLRMGLVGIKFLKKDIYIFYDENEIEKIEYILARAELIIGFNLVGHNGLDYKILENYGIKTNFLLEKTFDIMTVMIRTFGSYKNMSLANFIKHTFGIEKKITKRSNYKLIQNKQIDKVKDNLKHELKIIEMLFDRILSGGIVKFKTYTGFIDEHELPPMSGFLPAYEEELIEPYELPIAGIQMQIKNRYETEVVCSKCKKEWIIKSVSYFGDSYPEDVYCPNCEEFLTNITSNYMGNIFSISEKSK